MSDMRDLIEKLERIDERQNWDSLDAVVDQYAKTGMTLQDLASMEQAAKDVDENSGGISGFFKGLVSNESFRVNYVLYHAGEKLGLTTLIGTDGKIRTLDGGSYRAVRTSSSNVQHRNLAVQQARINLLPQAVQTIFSIQQGGANAQLRPTQEFFYSPNARSLQGHSIVRYRGKEPYADMVRQGQQTRVYFEEQYLEQFKAAYPNATVMKADGSGPLEAVAVDNAATVSTNNNVEVTPLANNNVAAVPQVFDTLDDFANSDLGGLRNDKDQIPAIRELQTFLTTDLGLDTGTVDGAYGPKTTEAVRKFQSAITGITVDGNVGPETIAKIKEVKADIAKIEEIIRIILADSIIPFKSAIAKMLESRIDEAELTDEQREVLERLLGKYENFRTVFPEFKSELFTSSYQALETKDPVPGSATDDGGLGQRQRPLSRSLGQGQNQSPEDGAEPEPAYKEVTGSGQGKRYRVYDRDGNELSTGRGSGPNLPLAADWNIQPEVFIQPNTGAEEVEDEKAVTGDDTKYTIVDGVREYSGDWGMLHAIQDTTLNTGDIIKINGKEAEIYSVPPLNAIMWPNTMAPFDPDGEPPKPTNSNAKDEQTGPLDWMNITPHDARNRIWKFTVPQDKSNQITGIGVLNDGDTVYLRQNLRRGRSVSGWMMARNPGFNAGMPLDSKQHPIVLKLISVLKPLGFDARGAIGLGMDNLGTTGDDILLLWSEAENRLSWDDEKLQDGINRIESREQMLSLLYAYRQQNNGNSLLDEFDSGSTIDDETKQLLNSTFLKFNIPVRIEV